MNSLITITISIFIENDIGIDGTKMLSEALKNKLSLFCSVPVSNVIDSVDVKNIYDLNHFTMKLLQSYILGVCMRQNRKDNMKKKKKEATALWDYNIHKNR